MTRRWAVRLRQAGHPLRPGADRPDRRCARQRSGCSRPPRSRRGRGVLRAGRRRASRARDRRADGDREDIGAKAWSRSRTSATVERRRRSNRLAGAQIPRAGAGAGARASARAQERPAADRRGPGGQAGQGDGLGGTREASAGRAASRARGEAGPGPTRTRCSSLVVDFPLFEWSDEEERWDSARTRLPRRPRDLAFEADPGRRGRTHDLVCNGQEIGGGSIRIHAREVQEATFRALSLTDEETRERFGHMLEAFEYGAPPTGHRAGHRPHGGALGAGR